ncbi:MAG: hypothetical protein ACTHYC_08240 [Sphingobacterium sp.]
MKNSILLGVFIGLIGPLIAHLLMSCTDVQTLLFPDKPTGLYVIAAAINLVGCWLSYKKGLDKFGNGLILATFLGMVLLVFTRNINIDL